MEPKRIQLSRAKGWRKPEGAVVVARPGIWGNPFTVADARDTGYRGTDAEVAKYCVWAFREWLEGSDQFWRGAESDAARCVMLDRLPELRGKDLCCWCPPGQPCHADVLLALANAAPRFTEPASVSQNDGFTLENQGNATGFEPVSVAV
jgi:hypothetical protein